MNILQHFKNIRTFVFDMDGVFTDGKIHIVPDPNPDNDFLMSRSMHTKDGYAVEQAVQKGYTVAIISGAYYEGAIKRFTQQGVKHIFMAIKNKKDCLEKFAAQENIDLSRALFMGDDIPDIGAMSVCSIKACPADAVPEVKAIADYISPKKGGETCVRDVIEKVLKLNNDWDLHTTITSA